MQIGRIASTQSPPRRSKPVKSWPCGQRAENWLPPPPPTGGSIASVWACAESTKNRITADAPIRRLSHGNCHPVHFVIEYFINLLLNSLAPQKLLTFQNIVTTPVQ
jgi:hypothetical protein